MKSLAVHYKNKYQGGKIDFSDDKLDAYDSEGNHRIALRRDGHGAIVDKSSELGASDKHDLSPIPKNSRVFKLHADGKIGLDELAEERKQASKKIAVDGMIKSIVEYKKDSSKYKVDAEGNVSVIEAAPVEPPKEPTAPQE